MKTGRSTFNEYKNKMVKKAKGQKAKTSKVQSRPEEKNFLYFQEPRKFHIGGDI